MSPAPALPAIVLVEDVDEIRSALATILESHGYAVHAAVDAGEALGHLQRLADPSVLLLDMMLPGLPGAALVRLLQREYPDILARTRLVAVTALPRLTEGLPFDAVVEKPFTVQGLLDVVTRVRSH